MLDNSTLHSLSTFESILPSETGPLNGNVSGNHLIIVDGAVQLSQQHFDDLLNLNTKVIQLDAQLDGIQQISDILAEQQNIDGLHIVSHGSQGQLQLGMSELNSDTFKNYQDQLTGWQGSFSQTGDILIYACDFGQGAAGTFLMQQLSESTNTDIAASNDLTGHSEFNADWDLEKNIGDIESMPFVLDGLEGVLGDVSNTAQQVLRLNFNQIDPNDSYRAIDTSTGTPVNSIRNDGVLRTGTGIYQQDPDGFQNGMVQLTGGNSGIDIANSPEINGETYAKRSIVVNFKADTINAGRQVIYEEGGGTRGLNIYTDQGKLYVGGWNRTDWDKTFLSTDQVRNGTWHQVVLTLNAQLGETAPQANAFKAYLDGTLFAQGKGSQLLEHNNKIALGNIKGNTRFHDNVVSLESANLGFDGGIGDIQIFNRVLNNSEISTLAEGFNTTSNPDPTPPPGNETLLNSNNPGFEKGSQDWNFVKTGTSRDYGEIRVVQNGDAYAGQKQLYMKLPVQATSNYDDQISINQTFNLNREKRYRVEARVKWLNPGNGNNLPSAIISLWARNPDQTTFSGKDFDLVANANGQTQYENLSFEFTPNQSGDALVWLGLFTHREGPGNTEVYVDEFKITEIGDAVIENDPRTGNLITNGDFSVNQNWQVTRNNPTNESGLVQSIQGGKLRLELPGTTVPDALNETWAGMYQTVNLKAGVSYELSADFDRDRTDQTRTIVNVYAYRPKKFSNSGELLLDEAWIGPIDYSFDCDQNCKNGNHQKTFTIIPTETADYDITFRVFGWANNGVPVKVNIDDVELRVKR